jgi:hypothetical protein
MSSHRSYHWIGVLLAVGAFVAGTIWLGNKLYIEYPQYLTTRTLSDAEREALGYAARHVFLFALIVLTLFSGATQILVRTVGLFHHGQPSESGASSEP